MNISEVAELFRAYIDEPDKTFVTDNDLKTFLRQGYREFRDTVTRVQPETFSTGATFPMTSATFNFETTDVTFDDLTTGKVLGASAADGRRLVKLIALSIKDASSNQPSVIFEPVTSVQALDQAWSGYMLAGTKVLFSDQISDTVTMDYVSEQSATLWDNLAATTEVDDLGLYHDIIALLASKQYAIRDGEFNQPLMAQLGVRMQDLAEGLTKRVVDAPRYVQRVTASNEY